VLLLLLLLLLLLQIKQAPNKGTLAKRKKKEKRGWLGSSFPVAGLQ
jgi:hypothetical protein